MRLTLSECPATCGCARAVPEFAIVVAARKTGSSIRTRQAPAPQLLRFFRVAPGDRIFLLFEQFILMKCCLGVWRSAHPAIRKTQLVIRVRLIGIEANGSFQTLDGRLQVAFL